MPYPGRSTDSVYLRYSLNVPPISPAIRKERDFIEGTSLLSSFRVVNSLGEPITPIEIRLHGDRLSLISSLIETNRDAYKHPEVLLDIAAKLGYRGDHLAELRILHRTMAATLAAKDQSRASDICQRCLTSQQSIRRQRDAQLVTAANDVVWRTCYEFGSDSGTAASKAKQVMLSHALLLAPGDHMTEILSAWQSNERALTSGLDARESRATHRRVPSKTHSHRTSRDLAISPTKGGYELAHSAAHAARTAAKAAASAYLPAFRSMSPSKAARGLSPMQRSNMGSLLDGLSPSGRSSPAGDASRTALSGRLQSGVSWLIGADER